MWCNVYRPPVGWKPERPGSVRSERRAKNERADGEPAATTSSSSTPFLASFGSEIHKEEGVPRWKAEIRPRPPVQEVFGRERSAVTVALRPSLLPVCRRRTGGKLLCWEENAWRHKGGRGHTRAVLWIPCNCSTFTLFAQVLHLIDTCEVLVGYLKEQLTQNI